MKVEVPKEQVVYANILWLGSIISIMAITVAYVLYVTGILSQYVEFDKIVELWGKKSHEFVEETNIPTGWDWIGLLGYGDFLNLLLLAILSFLTVVCYLAILPFLLAKKDLIYFVIALIEVVILILAASGLIVVGH